MNIAKRTVHSTNQMVCAFVFSLLLLAAGTNASAERVVRVGVYQNAPKVFLNEQGQPAGIFVDLLEEIAARQDWQLKYVAGSWAQGLDRLRRGELELMPDVAKTAQRETEFAFHQEPVLSDWFQIYARPGSGIKSLVNLDGKRLAVLDQSVQEAAFARLAAEFELRVSVLPFPDYQELFAAVADGRADAAISNRFYGVLYAEQHGLADTAIIFHPTRLYFATSPPGDQALLSAIDAELRRLKSASESAYFRILQHWTSEPSHFHLPGWVKFGGPLLLALLLLSFGVSLLLKRQVNARTAELQQSHHQLAKKMLQLEAELTTRQKVEAELLQAQKMESVGQLAGGIAHDFNNMLAVILGYAGLALKNVEPESGVYSDLQKVIESAQRSAEMTRQLLAFSRKQTIAPQVLDLNSEVEKILKMLRRLIGENIDLAWQPLPHIGAIKIDPAQLNQLLTNLCINARDAISGVGKVTIETGKRSFDESYCAQHVGFVPGDFVLLAVSDNGCGMDETTRQRIFEPFFTTKAVGKGTGLGLATVYGIVKQNSGFINVYSEPGKGTTFRIYLPLQQQIEEAENIHPIESLPSTQGETVLVVEDEEALLTLTVRMLENMQYQVLGATGPKEGIEQARQHTREIALLITDTVMPGMNGRQLAEQLQQENPTLKVLYMSGYTANVIAHQGILEEGVHFLPKPFSEQDLAQKVRETLDD